MEETNPSKTYKIKSPINTNHSIYFTIVDGEKSPVGFFLNSKEMESFQYFTPLMKGYAKAIRSGAPVSEVISDMKDTFDPKGTYLIPKKSKYVIFPEGVERSAHSLMHHLGMLLETHMKNFNPTVGHDEDHLTETFHPLEEEEK